MFWLGQDTKVNVAWTRERDVPGGSDTSLRLRPVWSRCRLYLVVSWQQTREVRYSYVAGHDTLVITNIETSGCCRSLGGGASEGSSTEFRRR